MNQKIGLHINKSGFKKNRNAVSNLINLITGWRGTHKQYSKPNASRRDQKYDR